MNIKEIYKYHYKQAVKAGIKQAFFSSLETSFTALFVTSLIVWIVDIKHLLIMAYVPLGVLVISTILFYFLKYKPDEETIAKEIDALGLEERAITMAEFKENVSDMLRLQREDTFTAIEKAKEKKIKFALPLKGIIAILVAVFVSSSMTTVSTLSYYGMIPGGDVIIDNIIEKVTVDFFEVVYEVQGEGFIEGLDEQIVAKGDDCKAVMAVAEDGFEFCGWSDGLKNPVRQDIDIRQDLTITALFKPLKNGGNGMPGPGGAGMEGAPSDQPGGQPGNGNNKKDKGNGTIGEGDGQQEGSSENSGSVVYETNDYIIDGEIYYGDYIDYYYNLAMTYVAKGEDVPPEILKIIEIYFDGIQ